MRLPIAAVLPLLSFGCEAPAPSTETTDSSDTGVAPPPAGAGKFGWVTIDGVTYGLEVARISRFSSEAHISAATTSLRHDKTRTESTVEVDVTVAGQPGFLRDRVASFIARDPGDTTTESPFSIIVDVAERAVPVDEAWILSNYCGSTNGTVWFRLETPEMRDRVTGTVELFDVDEDEVSVRFAGTLLGAESVESRDMSRNTGPLVAEIRGELWSIVDK